jgi:hypothetical protein
MLTGAVDRRQWAQRAPSSHTNVLHPAYVRVGKLGLTGRKGGENLADSCVTVTGEISHTVLRLVSKGAPGINRCLMIP